MTSTAKYTFEEPTYEPSGGGKKKHHRRAQSKGDASETSQDGDPLDGSGSLTYSAASSINSGSAAGESTDSSFADIMRVLDGQETGGTELAAVIKQARNHKEDRSVAAESLAYSTDGESHFRSLATDAESALQGTRYCSTVAGQPSDQSSDLGGFRLPMDRVVEEDQQNDALHATMDAEDSLLFAPAEHADSIKRRKDQKRRERQDRTPRTKNTRVTVESRQGTPPTARPPRAREYQHNGESEEDVWYAKWWMFCFPDAVRSMSAKR